jgi:methionine aminopeptidase
MELEVLHSFQKVQNAARKTLGKIVDFIRPGISEVQLVDECDRLQKSLGINGYWYKDLPALVLIGENTNLAISREIYTPSNNFVRDTDLITIDLNPSIDGFKGDYARSYYVENGKTLRTPIHSQEFLNGFKAQEELHATLRKVATPDMTANDLYQIISSEIDRMGFVQLDYLGHGINKDMDDLEFIAPGQLASLGDIGLFTLEPQIRLKSGKFAFKHENIYYFLEGKLYEL